MSDAPARIFISHSTKTASSSEFLTAVKTALEAAGYSAFVDSDVLTGGDEWRGAIFRYLEEAHAAVILISDSAQKSNWVGIEASILTFLVYRKLGFKVIPVVLSSELNEGIVKDVVGGTTIRQLVIPVDPADAGVKVVCALDEPAFKAFVRESLPPKLTRASFISKKLFDIGFNRTALDALTGTQNAGVSTDREACEGAAAALLDATFDDACSKVERINEILAAGVANYSRGLLAIAETLKPRWIAEADALLTIARARAARETERTLTIGTPNRFAVSSLVRRAHGSPVKLTAKIVYLADPGREDTLESFSRQLAAYFHQANIALGSSDPDMILQSPNAAQMKQQLQGLEKIPQPVLVVFPPGWPLDEFVDELRQNYPTLVLLFAESTNAANIHPAVPAVRCLDAVTVDAAESRYTVLRTALA